MEWREIEGPCYKNLVNSGELHENFERLEHESPSEASFGYSFAVLGLVIGALRLFFARPDAWIWIAAAVALAGLTRLIPSSLAPLNRAWFRFSLFIARTMSPIMMAVVYFAVITPMGLYARARGRKLLALEREPGRESYWIPVDEKKRSKFENQF